ncbi:MAG: hypothetical protein U9O59_08110 [Actinomycetota bacterium]|nr:hypothetical protein [Actinomycetota bacterium]
MVKKRNIRVYFYLSSSEYDRFRRKLAKAKITPSTTKSSYIRKCVLDKEIIVTPGLGDISNVLFKLIGELNSIDTKIKKGEVKEVGPNLKDIKKTIGDLYKELIKISRKIL